MSIVWKNTKNEPRSEYVTVCEMPFPDFPFFSMIRLSRFRCRRTLERWKMWREQSMLLTMRHFPSHLSVCVLCHPCGFWLYHPLHLPRNCILWWKTTLHKSLFSTWATPSLRTLHLGWSLFCLGVMFLKPFDLYFPVALGYVFFFHNHVHSMPWGVTAWFFLRLVWILQGVRVSKKFIRSLTFEFIPEVMEWLT